MFARFQLILLLSAVWSLILGAPPVLALGGADTLSAGERDAPEPPEPAPEFPDEDTEEPEETRDGPEEEERPDAHTHGIQDNFPVHAALARRVCDLGRHLADGHRDEVHRPPEHRA